jgi:16S rRNA (guanine527-N7)-methyltransferase
VDRKGLLKTGLAELGYMPDSHQIDAFMTYLSELKKWNRPYNLTGLKTDEDIIVKHFLDSLLYTVVIDNSKITIVDVGSGAGFPGIPMKIMKPEMELFLIEPSGKKSTFLRHIISELRLNKVQVIEKRVEEVCKDTSLSGDIGVTRALFSIKEFIKKASGIIKPEGRLIMNKGPKVKDELASLKNLHYEIVTLPLPLTDITRFLVIVHLK